MLSRVKSKLHEALNTTHHQQMMEDARQARQDKLDLEQSLIAWLRTDIGAAFNEKIQKRRKDALELLAKADPNDSKYIQKLQNDVALCSIYNTFCAQIALEASTLKT